MVEKTDMTHFERSKPRRVSMTALSGKAVLCALTLAPRRLPVENRSSPCHFDPTSNKIKVMTMKVSKGLEFPVVALPGVGYMPAPGEDEKEAARMFYVAATRAMQRLVFGVAGGFGTCLLK
jgi:superfamily I DNA/RNA helicase